jgi:hypothetical protein
MCESIKLANGTHVIACGDRRNHRFCVVCGREAVALCDWKIPSKESGTCDRPMCAKHSKEVARGKHLCPEHAQAWESWQRRHPDIVGPAPPVQQLDLFSQST